jgi:diacylglycerol kinase (ATP)
VWDLEQVRALINKFIEDSKEHQKMFPEWCFLDCECRNDRLSAITVLSLSACTAERCFRIDKAQENLHYVSDIAVENLYILDCGGGTVPQTPEDETAAPSPSSINQTSYIIPEMRVR